MSNGKQIYPDLIVHKRGVNDDNLLVIEFKTWWNSNTGDDIYKIENIISGYDYKFGVSIVLKKELEETAITFV